MISTQKEKAANDQAALLEMREEAKTGLGEKGTAVSKCKPGKFPPTSSWTGLYIRVV